MRRAKIEYGYISLDEFFKILDVIPPRDEMYAVMFCIIRFRGLRIGETCALKITDFTDDAARMVHDNTKKQRISIVDLPEIIRQRVLRFIDMNKHRFMNGYMFVGATSKLDHVHPDTVSKKFRFYFNRAGLKCDFEIDTNKRLSNAGRKLHHVRCYDLRASFGTDVQNKYKDLYITSVMLDHADTRSTQAYMRKAVLVKQKEILNTLYPA